MKKKLVALLVICSIVIGLSTTVAPVVSADTQGTDNIYKPNGHGFGS